MSLAADELGEGAARGLPWRAALAAVAGSVIVGFVPLATRGLYAGGMSPYSLLFWRYLLALVAMLAATRAIGLDLRGAARRGAWRLTALGATLGAMQTLCYFESLRRLDTGIAILLFYTYPVMTLALERFLFRRRVPPIAVVCVGLILCGAGLVAAPGLHSGAIDPRGFLWAVPGPLTYAFYLALNARLMARHPPLVGAGFLYAGFALTFLLAVLVVGLDAPRDGGGWLVLVFLAIGTGALSATLFSYSVPRLGPGSYAIIANCELVTVVLIGAAVLGERLTANRAVGGGLILAGILLHGLAKRRGAGQAAAVQRLRST